MSIDDPITAAQGRLEADARSVSPHIAAKIAGAIAGVLGVTVVKEKLENLLSQRESENVEYLAAVLCEEVRRLDRNALLKEDHLRWINREMPGLVLEAVRRAKDTRAKERIRRFASIIANALKTGPKNSPDLADEMLRIAADISDREIWALSVMCEIQGDRRNVDLEGPDMNQVNFFWKQIRDRDRLFRTAEIHSICSKLQSFGLVIPTTRNELEFGLEVVPYGVLPKGHDFLKYIKSPDD